jgi:hypothetical protein
MTTTPLYTLYLCFDESAPAAGTAPPTTPAPAVQFLGLNLTRAYARYLYTARARLSSHSAPSARPRPGFT